MSTERLRGERGCGRGGRRERIGESRRALGRTGQRGRERYRRSWRSRHLRPGRTGGGPVNSAAIGFPTITID